MDQAIGPSRRAKLTPDQQALLEKRIRGEIPSKSSTAKIPRRSDQSVAPLSLAQEGQWLLQHLQPENTVLNTFRALRIGRPIDLAVLETALTEVARRHDVLRANFRAIDGVPTQVFRLPEPVTVGLVDLSDLPSAEREAAFVRWSRNRTVEPFDLAQGELFRADLVRMAADDHIILFNLHHIICDGWSLGVLVRETMALYGAFAKGKPSPLPTLAVQYGDYAAWQRSKLQVDAVEKQMAFWRKRLAGAPTSTDLPFDHPRPPDRTFRGKRRGVTLDRPLVMRLRLLCQREQTTLFIVMMSALATLIHRYSGAADITRRPRRCQGCSGHRRRRAGAAAPRGTRRWPRPSGPRRPGRCPGRCGSRRRRRRPPRPPGPTRAFNGSPWGRGGPSSRRSAALAPWGVAMTCGYSGCCIPGPPSAWTMAKDVGIRVPRTIGRNMAFLFLESNCQNLL